MGTHDTDSFVRGLSADDYRNLVEHSYDGIFIQVDGRIKYMNERGAQLLGVQDPRFFIGKSLYDLFHPDYHQTIRDRVGLLFQGKPVPFIEEKLMRPDGSTFFAEVGAVPMTFHGKPGAQVIIHDITQSKKRESQLAWSEKVIDKLFLTLRESVFIIDPKDDRRILRCSPSVKDMFGYTQEEIVGSSASVLHVSPRSFKEFQRVSTDMLDKKGVFYTNYKMKTKDGRILDTRHTVVALGEHDGKTQVISFVRDVTQKMRLERENMKRLMSFDVDEGCVYLVKESESSHSRSVFTEAIRAGYSSAIFSRQPKERQKDLSGDCEYYRVAEIGDGGSIPPDLDRIEDIILSRETASAILIDRLDYYITRTSFGKVLQFVQHVNDIAYLRNHIIILSADPSTMTPLELNLLEKETRALGMSRTVPLSADLIEIIDTIFGMNKMGKKPTYTDIALKLGMSRPTLRKKIRHLIINDYLLQHDLGRKKILEVTKKANLS